MTDQPKDPQHISNVIPIARDRLETKSSSASPIGRPVKLGQALLDNLWIKMTEMYGHRWTASVGDSPDQDHAWASVLGGLNGRQIANGLGVLVEQAEEWPPSAPEFRGMCLHVPGLPSAVAAWHQALEGRYTHEVVKVAAKLTGVYELRQARLNDRPLQQIFDRNYRIVCQRAQNGQPLESEVHIGIGHDSQKTEAERAQEYAEQLLHKRIEEQGIPTAGADARKLLLARMGIKRDGGEVRA